MWGHTSQPSVSHDCLWSSEGQTYVPPRPSSTPQRNKTKQQPRLSPSGLLLVAILSPNLLKWLTLIKVLPEMENFFPVSDDRQSAHNAGDPGLIPGSGRSHGEGNGNPLQCPCLVNPMDRGAWRATVHRVARSQTQLKLLSTYARGVLVVTLGIFPLQCLGFSLVVPDGLQSTRLHSWGTRA